MPSFANHPALNQLVRLDDYSIQTAVWTGLRPGSSGLFGLQSVLDVYRGRGLRQSAGWIES